MAKELNENEVDAAYIRASVEKTQSRLIFLGVVLGMCLVGFCVKTCAAMPPAPIKPIPSVECIKATGKWVPESYTQFKNNTGSPIAIEAYCDKVTKPISSQ